MTRTNWPLVILIYLAGLLAAGQFAKVAVTLADLADRYPENALPFAVSAVSLAGIFFGVAAGVLVARVGPGRALIGAMLAGGALSVLQALMPPFPGFLVLRVLEGAAHLTLVVAAPTLMARVARGRDVAVAMGLWGTFFGVGFAVTALAAGLVGSPPWLFAAHGAALLILALALRGRLPVLAPVPRAERIGMLARHAEIYRSPRRVAPALGFFFHTVVFLGLLTFVPTTFEADWLAPALPLVALIGTFGAGVAARRIDPRRILLAGFALSILGYLVTLTLPEVYRIWAVLPLFALIGIVPGASFALVPALNPDPADQARANGALAQLGNVGTALSAPLIGGVLAFGGFAGMAVLTMVLSGVGLAASWLIHRKIVATP